MLLILLLLLPLHYPTEMANLSLTINGLEADKGTLNIALFPSQGNFPDLNEDTYTARLPVSGTTMNYQFPDVPEGTYALAVYQDINNNSKLDKNIWGVPKEPYAFSNGAIAKWSAPSFGDAAFAVKTAALSLELTLKNWSEW